MTAIEASIAAFVGAATLLTITPGLDTALVLRTLASGAARPALLAGFGIATGCFVWAVIVALGLGALLDASVLAYNVLRWLGAAYLVWTGYKMLRNPRRAFVADVPANQARQQAFATGALTNLLNPKVGVFYVSFLPQFVPHGVSVGPFILLLGAIHALIGMLWFTCLVAATRPVMGFLQRPRVVSACDRLTGAMFVAFGIGLALQRKSHG